MGERRIQFSRSEKRAEALREASMRRQVYGGLVNAGRLSVEEAARRIALMEAIAADYDDQMDMPLYPVGA